MSAHPDLQLSALLDGDLDEAAAADVRAHVAGCVECQSVLADLDALRTEARAWAEVDTPAAVDLWPGVLSRLESRDAGSTTPGAGHSGVAVAGPARWYRRRWSVGVPELALAASLAAAIAGALVWTRPAAVPATVAETTPVIAASEPLAVEDSAVTPVSFADAQYDAAVGDLERVLRDQRDRLDPRTVSVLERNLRIIDDAIGDAREALAADPANALLNAHLAGARRRKLDLLRRATLITEGN